MKYSITIEHVKKKERKKMEIRLELQRTRSPLPITGATAQVARGFNRSHESSDWSLRAIAMPQQNRVRNQATQLLLVQSSLPPPARSRLDRAPAQPVGAPPPASHPIPAPQGGPERGLNTSTRAPRRPPAPDEGRIILFLSSFRSFFPPSQPEPSERSADVARLPVHAV